MFVGCALAHLWGVAVMARNFDMRFGGSHGAGVAELACCGMPRYRRERVPGGTLFFTANLLERGQRSLVDHVNALRALVDDVPYNRWLR